MPLLSLGNKTELSFKAILFLLRLFQNRYPRQITYIFVNLVYGQIIFAHLIAIRKSVPRVKFP
jgi:hypothetical protein